MLTILQKASPLQGSHPVDLSKTGGLHRLVQKTFDFSSEEKLLFAVVETANSDLGNPQSGDVETVVIQASITAFANCHRKRTAGS